MHNTCPCHSMSCVALFSYHLVLHCRASLIAFSGVHHCNAQSSLHNQHVCGIRLNFAANLRQLYWVSQWHSCLRISWVHPVDHSCWHCPSSLYTVLKSSVRADCRALALQVLIFEQPTWTHGSTMCMAKWHFRSAFLSAEKTFGNTANGAPSLEEALGTTLLFFYLFGHWDFTWLSLSKSFSRIHMEMVKSERS